MTVAIFALHKDSSSVLTESSSNLSDSTIQCHATGALNRAFDGMDPLVDFSAV